MNLQNKKYDLRIVFSFILVLFPLTVLSVDWEVSGFIRQEAAYKVNGDNENPFNQHGNTYNNVPATNVVHEALSITPSTITRPNYDQDNDWNLFATRGELDVEGTFNENLRLVVKARAFFDAEAYDSFGSTSYFETPFRGDCATRLEVCGDNYMVDLPAAYLDYNTGPFWLRVGNQQIAWGESLFFRVMDVPNGLDLRRHSLLDMAAEEYSDKRVPALGARASYRFKNDWEVEGFIQEFQPTILGNENTPYNVIASQFVIQQEAKFDEVDDKWNFGGRLRGQVGELGLQFMAVSRRNPDGVYRWTTSKINPFVAAGIADPDVGGGVTLGQLLADTPFQPLTGQGVHSATEWFDYAGRSRLDGIGALQSTLRDFPVAAALSQPIISGFGLGDVGTYQSAATLLDAFFSTPAGGLGDLRGHLERYYPREHILGFGANYVFLGEPDTFLDQLVVRFEATYTPNKKFTDPSLSQEPISEDEWVTSFVLEKYHRFSQSFPATFMVFQWLHKTESDLFGRHLDGYNAGVNSAPPKGRNGFDAFTFALQQPFPNLTWRADLSVLIDPKGGYLVQPAVRWKPSQKWSAEAFLNIIGGGDDNNDALSTLDSSDELSLRVSYQF